MHSRQKPRKQLVQLLRPEPGRGNGMLQVQAVGVELGWTARRDHHSRGVAAELDDVEAIQHGIAERARETVVWGGGPGEEVYLRRWLGAHNLPSGVRALGWDWDCKEGCHCNWWYVRSKLDSVRIVKAE